MPIYNELSKKARGLGPPLGMPIRLSYAFLCVEGCMDVKGADV